MIALSIIIISYNTKVLTLQCIQSVINQYKKELEEKRIEVIVVDNNSTDGSPSIISNIQFQISNFKLIINKENVGFAKGCNIGVKNAKGKYVLFLNSDTQVLDKGFLLMIELLEKNPKIAILGGKIHNADGSIQRSAGKFYNLLNLTLVLLGMERIGFVRSSPSRVQKVDWVSGACLMVKGDIFDKLKGFDEELFMYMEDMEICYRAKKLGFSTYFYPSLNLRHKSWGSSSRTFAIMSIYRGILHFYSKHKNSFEYIIAKALLVAKAEILILIGFLTFNKSLRDTYRKAIS